MLDIRLLGQGGMYPLPERYLTSLMIRYQGEYTLIDCGEGTQVAIREAGWGFKQIGTICITHFHGDHITGLPGLLMTIGNSGRTEPVTLIGPTGLRRVVEHLLVIAPIVFPLTFIELTGPRETVEFGDYQISAQFVEHGIPCYGYRFDVSRQGEFQPDQAKNHGIPVRFWSLLQKGEIVEEEGEIWTPSMVLGPPRKGISVTYTTDLRPSSSMVDLARKTDLFICEGNYGDPEKQDHALKYQHTTFQEAAEMAKEGEVKELWLTHFSPSMMNPEEYLPLAQKIFPKTYIHRLEKKITFED